MRNLRRFLRDKLGQRGQSLVEFALTLPMLMLFLLITIDFGRVFIGYVNVQNMTRIAANYASLNPTAWEDGITTVEARYKNQILADASSTGCNLPKSGTSTTVPDPQFPDGTAVGGTAKVEVTCSFKLISPFWSWFDLFPGLSIPVTATAEFPIRTGMSGTAVAPGAVTPPIANFDGIPQTHKIYAGQSMAFVDESGGVVDSWSWCLDWNSTTKTCAPNASSSERDPVFVYYNPGQYTVRLVVSNAAGSNEIVKEPFVTVYPTDLNVDFTIAPSTGPHPLHVTFTGTTTSAITSWSWNFGDPASGAANTANTQVATHTYTVSGNYTVTLTVVPDSGLPFVVKKTNSVSVTDQTCIVPNFAGHWRSEAPWLWSNAGFSGTLTSAANAPTNHDFKIGYQSITGLSPVPCTSNIQVSKVAP